MACKLMELEIRMPKRAEDAFWTTFIAKPFKNEHLGAITRAYLPPGGPTGGLRARIAVPNFNGNIHAWTLTEMRFYRTHVRLRTVRGSLLGAFKGPSRAGCRPRNVVPNVDGNKCPFIIGLSEILECRDSL